MNKQELSTAMLREVRFQVERRFPAWAMNSIDVRHHMVDHARQLVTQLEISLTGEVMGEKHCDVEMAFAAHFQTPATWWQHFKKDCFPRWLLRWFPVRYQMETKTEKRTKRVVYEQIAVYPEFGMRLPPNQNRVFTTYERRI